MPDFGLYASRVQSAHAHRLEGILSWLEPTKSEVNCVSPPILHFDAPHATPPALSRVTRKAFETRFELQPLIIPPFT